MLPLIVTFILIENDARPRASVSIVYNFVDCMDIFCLYKYGFKIRSNNMIGNVKIGNYLIFDFTGKSPV